MPDNLLKVPLREVALLLETVHLILPSPSTRPISLKAKRHESEKHHQVRVSISSCPCS